MSEENGGASDRSTRLSRRTLLRTNLVGLTAAAGVGGVASVGAARTVETLNVPEGAEVTLNATVDAEVTFGGYSGGGEVTLQAGDVDLYSLGCTPDSARGGCTAEETGVDVTVDVTEHAGAVVDVTHPVHSNGSASFSLTDYSFEAENPEVSIEGDTDQTVGDTETFVADVTGSASDSSFTWWVRFPGDDRKSEQVGVTDETLEVSFDRPGRYDVQVSVDGTSAFDSMQVDVPDPDLTVSIEGPGSRTAGQSGTYEAEVDGEVPPVSYDWGIHYPGDPKLSNLTAGGPSVEIDFAATGIHTVDVGVSDGTESTSAQQTVSVSGSQTEFSVRNPRLVQTVEDTRVHEDGTGTIFDDVDDPQLVSGRRTLVTFDLAGTAPDLVTWSELDASTLSELTATVSAGDHEATYQFDESAWATDDGTPPIVADEYGVSTALSSADLGAITFELPDDVEEVSVELSHPDESVTGDSEAVQVEREVVDVAELNVVLRRIEDPSGSVYPTVSEDRLEELADVTESFLRSQFPVSSVVVETASEPIVGHDPGECDLSSEESRLRCIERDARMAFDGGFDATVLLVDGAYFDHYLPGTAGINQRAAETASIVDASFGEDIVAHEIGHGFGEDTYFGPASSDEAGPHPLGKRFLRQTPQGASCSPSGIHARTASDVTCENAGIGLRSVVYDLYDQGPVPFCNPDAPALMAYEFPERFQRWDVDYTAADSRIYRDLADAGSADWAPAWQDSSSSATRLVTARGSLGGDGHSVDAMTFSEGRPMAPADGDVTVRVVDAQGDVVDERTTRADQEVPVLAPDHDGLATLEDHLSVAVPFPQEAHAVEVEYDGTSSTFYPQTEVLSTAVDRVPDAAFGEDAEAARDALHAALDLVETSLSQGAFEDAMLDLLGQFRSQVEDLLESGADAAPNQVTKAELVERTEDAADVTPDPTSLTLEGPTDVDTGTTYEYEATLDESAPDATYTWKYKHEDSERASVLDVDGATALVTFPTEGTYGLVASTDVGEQTAADALTISAEQGLSASLSGPSEAEQGGSAEFVAETSGCEDVAYEWEVRHPDDERPSPVDASGETLTIDLPTTGQYAVQLVVEGCGQRASASAGLTVVETPAPGPCPEAADATEVGSRTVCDVDGDDLYEDVDGNGEVTHADVQEFFAVQHRPTWKQPGLFDFNENEVVGHGDVIALFEDVATGSL